MTPVSATSLPTSTVVAEVWGFMLSCQTELLLFCAAIAAYLLLFAHVAPRHTKTKKVADQDSHRLNAGGAASRRRTQRGDRKTDETVDAASYHHSAMGVALVNQAVESMQHASPDRSAMMRELEAFVKRCPKGDEANSVNCLIEALTKRVTCEVIESLIELLPSVGLKADQKTYEVVLGSYVASQRFPDMNRIIKEMKRENIPLTIRANISVIKAAMKTSNFEEAIMHFRSLKSELPNSSANTTASLAPRHIIGQIAELACKTNNVKRCISEFVDVPITDEVVHTLLSDCVRRKDVDLMDKVDELARERNVLLSESSQSLLIKGFMARPPKVERLFNEITAKRQQVGSEVARSLLSFCGATKNLQLADRLYAYMKPRQMPVLVAFVNFFCDSAQYDKACDLYEHEMQEGAQATSASALPQSLFLDASVERSLIDAALRCGRGQLAKGFLQASTVDVAKHVSMIRSCTAAQNVKGAKDAFELIQQSGAELNSVLYNAVLDVCVECSDIKEAEAWMQRMQKAEMCDVVTYNTLIKAHLRVENFGKARKLVDEMRARGLQPNRVTFNELVNGIITKGTESERARKWDLIREMKDIGVAPNQVTCAILLKSLNARSSQKDITETMELIDTMQEPMDEILVSSVVEACVRIGQPALIASKLRQINTDSLAMSGSHTFGSLIKAYGVARNMEGAWRCWKEMRSRRIKPTAITLGCMVEAVVSNGDPDGAYELVQDVKRDEQLQGMLNSVIYCSVLKGFAREKKLERLWQVYKEMVDEKIDVSVVTYNTLIDACVRSDHRNKVPAIVEDMKSMGVRPNIITYSSIIKGHCLAGDVQKGFEVMDEMKRTTDFKPDEIMYNSLLDGCANCQLTEAGIRVIQMMQSEGVPPSNYTLSIIVKLLSRARKLEKAFALVDEICQKYRFRPNVHVRTNLIQACISNRQLNRAVSTLEDMVAAGVRPEARAYAILVRACLQQGRWGQAAELLRGGLGLPGAPAFLRGQACPDLEQGLVGEALSAFASSGQVDELAMPLIADIKEFLPRFRIDNGTQSKVMASSLSGTRREPPRSQNSRGKGSKGEGKGGRRRE